jgi:hypothetical protein
MTSPPAARPGLPAVRPTHTLSLARSVHRAKLHAPPDRPARLHIRALVRVHEVVRRAHESAESALLCVCGAPRQPPRTHTTQSTGHAPRFQRSPRVVRTALSTPTGSSPHVGPTRAWSTAIVWPPYTAREGQLGTMPQAGKRTVSRTQPTVSSVTANTRARLVRSLCKSASVCTVWSSRPESPPRMTSSYSCNGSVRTR